MKSGGLHSHFFLSYMADPRSTLGHYSFCHSPSFSTRRLLTPSQQGRAPKLGRTQWDSNSEVSDMELKHFPTLPISPDLWMVIRY